MNNQKSMREKILDDAKVCVCGHRKEDYGTPEDSFGVIAEYWNTYLGRRPGTKEAPNITAKDVSVMMALLKVARITTGTGARDSFVDLAGYAACGGEIAENEPKATESSATNNDPPVIEFDNPLYDYRLEFFSVPGPELTTALDLHPDEAVTVAVEHRAFNEKCRTRKPVEVIVAECVKEDKYAFAVAINRNKNSGHRNVWNASSSPESLRMGEIYVRGIQDIVLARADQSKNPLTAYTLKRCMHPVELAAALNIAPERVAAITVSVERQALKAKCGEGKAEGTALAELVKENKYAFAAIIYRKGAWQIRYPDRGSLETIQMGQIYSHAIQDYWFIHEKAPIWTTLKTLAEAHVLPNVERTNSNAIVFTGKSAVAIGTKILNLMSLQGEPFCCHEEWPKGPKDKTPHRLTITETE